MNVTFRGAAREVTGSCHLLEVGRQTVALDCGLFQGRRAESHRKNLELPAPIESLDAVILSHAHIDHSGRLPYLVRQGYRKTIWATPATRDLCALMLADSAHIQKQDAEHLAKHHKTFIEPLYRQEDVDRTVDLINTVPYGRTFEPVAGIEASFLDAGHILGSAIVVLDCKEGRRRRRLVFSGDLGRTGQPIIRDPWIPTGADHVIMESTYGDRVHVSTGDMREELGAIVRTTAARGGRVLIPAFAVGRTQEIIYDLHALHREGKIPAIPICVDSPLAIDVTGVFAMHREIFDQTEPMVQDVEHLFDFPLVRYTRDVSESKALDKTPGPMVIIAASGMMESGRILHHLGHGAADQRNTILIVGFQAEHTLGRRIVEGRTTLRIFDEEIPLRAEVRMLTGYSAHADEHELVQWLEAVAAGAKRRPHVTLVHGETDAQNALAATLSGLGYDITVPANGESVPV
ncbi:MAG TPA: MBL fold metallo-hydrolase [Gemmatimonadaceae bacterium]|nr:MBL fold metallo-hydrolase [Gemmatimonadaceae bacterium]